MILNPVMTSPGLQFWRLSATNAGEIAFTALGSQPKEENYTLFSIPDIGGISYLYSIDDAGVISYSKSSGPQYNFRATSPSKRLFRMRSAVGGGLYLEDITDGVAQSDYSTVRRKRGGKVQIFVQDPRFALK